MFNTTTVSASLDATITATFGQTPAASGGVSSTNPTHASTTMQGGKAVFENDNYRITAGDNNEINIHNKATGENYQIWGDPHVNVDGKHAFDFWGTTTFELNDGTKLTVETVPASNNMTLASKLTITNGDYCSQITGIDTNKVGDLHVEEGAGWGVVLDAAVEDGNTLLENANGKGFVAVDDSGQLRQVDQAYINATDLQKGGARPPLQPQQREAADLFRNSFLMGGLIAITMAGMLLRNQPRSDDSAAPTRGGDRAWAGGTPNFDESFGGNNFFRASVHVDLSFSLTLTRWNG